MKDLSRVVWHEGMHLAQHHFQAQNRYFEDSVRFALSQLYFETYGLAGCELDAEALRNGTVSLLHARGVMPDGLAFHMPEGDERPAPIEIRELFSPTRDSHAVMLAIPPYRPDGSNCALPEGEAGARRTAPNGGPPRYVAERVPVLDEVSGRDEKTVTIGRKNFRLALDAEPLDGLVTMPIARVQRDGSGSFAYDSEYIPPALHIGAIPALMALLRRLVESLESKSDAMMQARAAQGTLAGDGLAEYASREIANFWLLHTVHSSLAPLRHHLAARRAHPEQLYEEMARLAGALCTFAFDSHPRAIPAYDHAALADCFGALARHIRAHLEVVLPSSAVVIPLTPVTAYLYNGAVTDKRCFGRSQWILGLRSAASPADVITRVPQLVKVCSAKFTPELVRRAYPGLRLDHLPTPPSAVSPRADTQYFLIARQGPCWDTTVQTGQVGVYIPDAFPEAEPELKVIVET